MENIKSFTYKSCRRQDFFCAGENYSNNRWWKVGDCGKIEMESGGANHVHG
jgi:hypothetical protein